MFEIKVTDADVTGGSIPISWCLDIETVHYLTTRKVVDPQVVIVIAPEGEAYSIRKEYRKVVSLRDLLAYVEFRAPGKNKIWAFISHYSKQEAKNKYLSREDGEYRTDVLTSDGTAYLDYLLEVPQCNSESVSVDVPAGVFASEPEAWEKTWVNHFFRDKCVDQCDFRRRRLFAYGVQPFIMLGQLLLRAALLLLALAIGARNTSAMPLLHPLRYCLNDAALVIGGGSIFIKHLDEDDDRGPDSTSWKSCMSYFIRSFWALPFMPLVAIPLGIALYHHKAIFVGSIFLGAIAVVMLTIFFLTGSGLVIFKWVSNKFTSGVGSYLDKEEIDMLTCNPNKKAFTFGTLPAKKKTLSLRFSDLKSKVCRPFST